MMKAIYRKQFDYEAEFSCMYDPVVDVAHNLNKQAIEQLYRKIPKGSKVLEVKQEILGNGKVIYIAVLDWRSDRLLQLD